MAVNTPAVDRTTAQNRRLLIGGEDSPAAAHDSSVVNRCASTPRAALLVRADAAGLFAGRLEERDLVRDLLRGGAHPLVLERRVLAEEGHHLFARLPAVGALERPGVGAHPIRVRAAGGHLAVAVEAEHV